MVDETMGLAVSIKFPAPMPAEIPCPICRVKQGKLGGGCIACDFTGKLHITVDAKIPIQRAHIIKYVADNLSALSSELTRLYRLVPEIDTKDMQAKMINDIKTIFSENNVIYKIL